MDIRDSKPHEYSGISPFQKLFRTRYAKIFLCLTIFIFFQLYIHVFKSIPDTCLGYIVSDMKHKQHIEIGLLQLRHLYRERDACQRLDLDNQYIIGELGTDYQNVLAQFKLTFNEDDDLWPTVKLFETENPFNFTFKLRGKYQKMMRLRDRSPKESDFSDKIPEYNVFDWTEDDVLVPDVQDKTTILSLATFSSNAYVGTPHEGNWRNISEDYRNVPHKGFGWDKDGLRGHVFVDEDSKVVVIAIKGTSAKALIGGGDSETTENDKINDNLLFSCCCARVGYLWTPVCDCYEKAYTCGERCLESELRQKDRYYTSALNIYKDVYNNYENYTIWVTGHSLGGALAAMLGHTYGIPTVTFESPGDELPSKRLHLPHQPGIPRHLEAIWHFGHTADPIFLGTCTGASSSCSIGGYAMESSCHTGQVCVYDVVRDHGWHVSLLNHKIHSVIDNIIEKYDEVPLCTDPEPCVDCFNWSFIDETNQPDEEK